MTDDTGPDDEIADLFEHGAVEPQTADADIELVEAILLTLTVLRSKRAAAPEELRSALNRAIDRLDELEDELLWHSARAKNKAK